MASRSGGVNRFTQLADVPQSYVGLGNQLVTVKGTENGLETIPQSGGPVTTFLSLTDCPHSYAGTAGQHPEVNTAENALIFKFYGIRNVNVNAVVIAGDYTIIMDASGGDRTVGIVDATTNTGRILNIKRFDASLNTLTIFPIVGGQTIEFVNKYLLTSKGQSITIQSDGANWYII
jgi:hypothetical protein